MKGEAEAFAIEAKAKAEAEQMAKKADAWKEYREAAVVDMVLETMPKVWMNVALVVLTILNTPRKQKLSEKVGVQDRQ